MTGRPRPDRPWPDPNVYGWIEHPDSPDDWEGLVQEHAYDPQRREPASPDEVPVPERPLRQIFKVVREHGCETVLIENRYVDADYRSEYSRYWSRTFKGRPAFARRLHFFKTRLEEADLAQLPPTAERDYLGYTVLRPVPMGPVGRTVIVPPPSLSDAVLALVDERVHVFGQTLSVLGAPFCQQDGQFLRCAHAAAWMCHYSAYRRGLVGRQVTAAIADAVPPSLSFDRLVPSHGMNALELQAAFGTFSLPAFVYDLDDLPDVVGVDKPDPPERDEFGNQAPGGFWNTRLFSVACRHLNGAFPVLVATATAHAFTLVGWTRTKGTTTFIANDDVEGPYVEIASPFEDDRRMPWTHFMVPAPPNIFLSGEMAEDTAQVTIRRFADDRDVSARTNEIATLLTNGELNVRTALRDGSVYKQLAAERGFAPGLVQMLRRDLFLSHWVWVTEIHDPRRCEAGEPCVVAEALCDSTSEDAAPYVVLLILPDGAVTFPPEPGAVQRSFKAVPEAWTTVLGACGRHPPRPEM